MMQDKKICADVQIMMTFRASYILRPLDEEDFSDRDYGHFEL